MKIAQKILLFCFVLLGLALLGLGVRQGLRMYAQRQVSGRLSFDAATLPATRYTTGQFQLAWETRNGGHLVVYHQRQPDRVIWATLPGHGFVAAAQGSETVTDSRGHFFVTDRLEHVCTNQHITAISSTSAGVVVSGRLACPHGYAPVDYTVTFTSTATNQLRFTLDLTDLDYNRTFLTYQSDHTEHFFGFGTQYSFFDLKGQRLPIFVGEQGIGRGAQPITTGATQAGAGGDWHTTYAGVPQYITSHLRSLFLETYEYAVFDLRRADRVQIQLFAPHMAGRILYGETPTELIAQYTAFAGRMRPLPNWILDGAIVGMQGGTQRVRDVWQMLQQHNTPIAAFWLQDWVGRRQTSFGSQLWWNWELDQNRYPGWEALRADLSSQNIRLMTYINPFLVDATEQPHHRRNLFAEASEQGFLVKNDAGQPYTTRITDFSAALIDLTNPDAYAWLKQVITQQVIGVGASGWMADFGEGLPYDARLFSGESAARYHNRYPEVWATLNREVIEETGHGDEMVFFMRAGYTHSPQATTLFWLGDQLVDWDAHDGIKTAVTGMLSSGMSGFSLQHSDIGGYTAISHPLRNYQRSKELLLRWMELNAFTTIYRTHEGNRPELNAQFYADNQSLVHFSQFAHVYKAWAFYRQQLVAEAALTGLPVVRHPFIHYPDDPMVYRLSYQQFMVGTEFMVAPVLDPGHTSVTIYLPAGHWVHLWSGTIYGSPDHGVTVTVPAPLGQPGVFYQEGSPVGAQFRANLGL